MRQGQSLARRTNMDMNVEVRHLTVTLDRMTSLRVVLQFVKARDLWLHPDWVIVAEDVPLASSNGIAHPDIEPRLLLELVERALRRVESLGLAGDQYRYPDHESTARWTTSNDEDCVLMEEVLAIC
jgi:hypothetical protein